VPHSTHCRPDVRGPNLGRIHPFLNRTCRNWLFYAIPKKWGFWGHRRIRSKSYAKRHRGTRSTAFAGPKPLFERFGQPDVVAIEADVLPAERSDVGENLVGQRFALGAKFGRTASIGIVPRSRSVLFKGGMSPTRAARHTGFGRSTLYRDGALAVGEVSIGGKKTR
jgi:hypothetical protein